MFKLVVGLLLMGALVGCMFIGGQNPKMDMFDYGGVLAVLALVLVLVHDL